MDCLKFFKNASTVSDIFSFGNAEIKEAGAGRDIL